MLRAKWLVLFWLVLFADVGCDSEPPPPEPPSLVATGVDGEPTLVSPTAPIRIQFSAAPDPASLGGGGVALVEGIVDASSLLVLDKAGTKGEDATLRDRLAPLRVVVDPLTPVSVELQLMRALTPETLYTLVVTTQVLVGDARLAHAEMRQFSTANTGAPVLSLSAPDDGAVDVVRNLRQVVVQFSRPVHDADEGSLGLVDDAGNPVASRVSAGASVGEYAIEPLAALSSDRHYSVRAAPTIHDDDGQAPFVPDLDPGFSTGTTLRTQAPRITAPDLLASSGCLVVSFATNVPATTTLCVDGDCAGDPRLLAIHQLLHLLAAGGSAVVTLRAQDESTAPMASFGPVAAPATSPRTLVISEVFSHSKMGRLAQQWVEIQNRGALPVSVDGLELHDEKGANTLPAAIVAPGGFALLVPNGYVVPTGSPDADTPPRVGTLLVRLDESHIGGNGIRETGEALSLVEPDGRPVSRFSTEGLTLAPGQSAHRIGPCDVAASWEPTPDGAASPGGL